MLVTEYMEEYVKKEREKRKTPFPPSPSCLTDREKRNQAKRSKFPPTARFVLNFKNLDYETEWVQHPDISSVLQAQ